MTISIKSLMAALALAHLMTDAYAQETIDQNFKHSEALWISDDSAGISRIRQTGTVKRYTEAMLTDGVHFRTGKETVLSASIVPGDYHAGGLLGVHGAGSHVIFRGHWRGDQGGSFPMLVLRDGGKMTWAAEAHIDFVMHPNFFTRQLWVWGDGTGVLELAEGFVSDRSQGGTVADAMGTIRLVGTTLITHHSQSLPYNTRPDGRGGTYHNGHVVFEGELPSTWSVRTNPHFYAAQIDFDTDGCIDCQADLTHHGHIRVCLPVGNGGHFVSSGAFRSTRPDVTITKTGQGMLSLDGQQAWQSGATLIVAEGLLRIHSDPADSARLGAAYGNHLRLLVRRGAKVVFSASHIHLADLTVEAGATVWQLEGCTVEVAGKKEVSEEANWTTGNR